MADIAYKNAQNNWNYRQSVNTAEYADIINAGNAFVVSNPTVARLIPAKYRKYNVDTKTVTEATAQEKTTIEGDILQSINDRNNALSNINNILSTIDSATSIDDIKNILHAIVSKINNAY
jgi:hypothetical protein